MFLSLHTFLLQVAVFFFVSPALRMQLDCWAVLAGGCENVDEERTI
jgi:hypothetical protein